MRCKRCGAGVDPTSGSCPACGAEVELGRLTGILGVVCRGCDAYNEPGAKTCVACGDRLSSAEPTPPAPISAPRSGGQGRGQGPSPGGGPVVRTFHPPSPTAATRFVPAMSRRAAPARPAGPSAPTTRMPAPPPASCSRCGAKAAADARFCSQCGQALCGPRAT